MPFCPGRKKSGGIGSGSYPSCERSRYLQCLKDLNGQVNAVSLHTFTDASENAYFATVYSQHEHEDGTVTT